MTVTGFPAPFVEPLKGRLVCREGDPRRPELVMTVPRSVADVLDRHVTFEIESIDRMYLNVYQPLLQYPRGAAGFFRFHRGHAFASSALMAPMTKAFVTAIGEFIEAHGLDLVHFAKDQR